MNTQFLSELLAMMLRAIAPALGNHVWQSTFFLAVAGLLTLILRKNHARARYWLWLTASLKFLIPFSWLVALGSHLAWWQPTTGTSGDLYYTIEEISQPFTQSTTAAVSPSAASLLSSGVVHWLLALLAGIWLCGLVAVLLIWCVRWRRIAVAIRCSTPLREGREVEILRRLESVSGMRQRVEMLLSPTTLEPGIFGLSRPVLVWPEGISQHLDPEHLEAILAHELWHVRRRDNLAAAAHMIVEAIFWFHPLVWWLGARLVDERERACDEEVLELGSQRRVYAESILKVCEFCVGSPLACVSGVTGADLKKRMVHVMSEHIVSKLDLRKKLLLVAAGILAIAAPIVVGFATASPGQSDDTTVASPAFDKVSITPSAESRQTLANAVTKNHILRMYGPDGFFANHVTLRSMIEEAYGVQDNQIVGGPDWLSSAAFDIQARIGNSGSVKPGFQDRSNLQKKLQTLLADHAKLALHSETRELPSYALVVSDGGLKLQQSADSEAAPGAPLSTPPSSKDLVYMQSVMVGPNGQPEAAAAHSMRMQVGENQVVHLSAQGISITTFTDQLSRQLGVNVADKTGLKGNYNFSLQWQRSPDQSPSATSDPSIENAGSSASLMTAIQDQLGLKLEPQTQTMPVLVVDHIEKPTEN
jgi:bla regulator protein blaR1